MAIDLGVAYLSIVPSTSRIAPEVNRSLGAVGSGAQAQGQSIGQRLAAGMSSAMKKAAKAGMFAAGIAVGGSLISGFKSAIDQQKGEKVLAGLYGSAKQATAMMKSLRDVSSGSALNYTAYMRAAQNLAYAGVKGKEATATLRNVGKAISAAGGDSESLDRATDAILGMVNAGKVQLYTLNQLSKTGVPIYSGLAKHFGKSIADVRQMATDGKIKLDDVLSVMKNGTGATFKQMIRAGDQADKSFGSVMARMKDNVSVAIGQKLVPLLDKAAPAIESLGNRLGGSVTTGLNKMGTAASAATQTIRMLWNNHYEDGPIGPTNRFIPLLFSLREAVTSVWEKIKPWLREFGDGMAAALQKVGPLLEAMSQAWSALVAAAKPYLKLALAGALAALHGALKVIPPVFGALLTVLTKCFQVIKPLAPVIAAVTAAFVAYKIAAFGVAKVQAAAAFTRTAIAAVRLNAQMAIAIVRMTAVSAAQKVAAVGARLYAAGQWLVNAAVSANPLGLLIIGLVALGAAFVVLWKKSDRFRAIVTAAWNGIKAAATATVGWFKNTAWPWMRSVLTWIGDKATWLWKSAIRPTFQFIGKIARSVFGWIKNTGWPWVRKAFNGIGAVAKWLWNKIIRPYFGFYLKTAKAVFGWIKNTGLSWIQKAFRGIGSVVRTVWRATVKPVFSAMKKGVRLVKDAFSAARDGIQRIWNGLKRIAARPVEFAINTVIGGLLGAIGKIPGLGGLVNGLKGKLGIPVHFAATGMTVPGQRRPYGDKVLYGLAPGEEVVSNNRGQADRYRPLLKAINAGRDVGGIVPGLARGGTAGGHTWPLIWNYVRKHWPGVAMTSNYRPGSMSMRRSSHALGTAIDIGGPQKLISAVMTSMMRRFGRNMRDMIYSPLWGHRMVSDGRWIGTPGMLYRQHFNHGHIGLLPGRGLGGGPPLGKGGAPNTGLGGLFGWSIGKIKDLVSGGIKKLTGKFGDSIFAKAGISMVQKVPGAMWGWVKDKISALMPWNWGDAEGHGSLGKNLPAQLAVKTAARMYGWDSGAQWRAISHIVSRESGWNPRARNASSGAYGLFQALPPGKMASAGSDWRTNADTQAKWGIGYIARRYGNPTRAWDFWQRHHWYDQGGVLRPGLTVAANATGKPEAVLTNPQWRTLEAVADNRQAGGDTYEIHVHGVQTNNADDVAERIIYQLRRTRGRYAGV